MRGVLDPRVEARLQAVLALLQNRLRAHGWRGGVASALLQDGASFEGDPVARELIGRLRGMADALTDASVPRLLELVGRGDVEDFG